MPKGKLVVFEGIDGSGKTTQINLLKEKLNIPYEEISFPQYGQNEYANQIQDYLEGKFGNLNEVDPKEIAKIYAGDRLSAKETIKAWLETGKLVLVNRYVGSSKAHLGANLPEEKRAEFISWIDKLEYEENGLPREEMVFLLDVDSKVSQQHVAGKDIHEQNLRHLEEARKIFLQLAKQNPNWHVINCMDNSQMKSREEIHQEIKEIIKDLIK